MKKTHIIAIIVVAVAIAFILSSVNKSSSYADFHEAFDNPGIEYHVVGTLDKTAQIIYEPTQNANLTTFTMIDNQGVSRKVYLNKSKPQDFERSESVVVIGKAEGDDFHASEMLMKCPSKYKEEGKFEVGESSGNIQG